ncbi:sodium/proline symporter PutP [Clostridium sp. AM58-1XD]|uniref:sodium/proline symporter PutP n=1 Tax=Clostridium sp. AM58-1XD TaxID=2292307 RepID=UPI000E4BD2FF|nr:sodium/proline symporter PutP [Clostridium sp. AM58-1XD]RGY96202.1 sodium/proline symporter PutP [Clostridium sp. AM58-1XD]
MTTAQLCILISISIYLAMMLAVGFICSKNNNTTDDFYLGGRKLGPFVTAMSAEASDMSSWLLMGLPGVAYLSGICDAGWTAIGLAAGTYLNWLFVAKRIRRYSHIAGNSITIPDFFSNRYRDKSRLLMLFSALIILIFFIPYTASGFAACGKLFASLFGIHYGTAMIISALVIVAYTTMGGFLAASTTDFIQSIVMTIALVIVLFFGTHMAGGFEQVMENAKSLPGYLSMFFTYQKETGAASPYGAITIISTMAWGLGYFGMPHILLRFMAIEEEEKLTLSRRIATVWVVISLAIGVVIGVIGLGMTKAGTMVELTGSNSETIVVRVADLLSHFGVLPALVAGVILAGILACTMSTSDSQLLAAASGVSQNIFKGVMKINMSEKAMIITARVTVLIISLIAMFIARNPDSSVFAIVSFAWAGFGASFGPVVICALFWKRSNRNGALAGMITGGVVVFVWKYLVRPLGGAWDIYELLPAFAASCIVIAVVSLATAPPEQEIMDEFERARG